MTVGGRNKFIPLPSDPEIPLLGPVPSWIDARHLAAAHFNCLDGIPSPDSLPNESVLSPVSDDAAPAAMPTSELVAGTRRKALSYGLAPFVSTRSGTFFDEVAE